MGQAASYAESSVQRALLKLKHEEQNEEDELLRLCGYARPSTPTTAAAEAETAHSPVLENDCGGSYQRVGSSHGRASPPLPPPPECFGPFVSLDPEYYSLDELRDALRFLPDTLWVSLYRVSLLYVLDNDNDGRVKSTDISFFMDWGIKTVGRDVPLEQLAEVLQTCAALHCWHRCLHVGEVREMEKAAQQQQSGRGGAGSGVGGGGAGPRPRRRNPLQSTGASPSNSSPNYHPHHQSQSVLSFMLLHLREAFFRSHPGGPVPLPSDAPAVTAATATMTSNEGGLFSPVAAAQFFSPRSVVTQPVTSATRTEAAAHFAEWMLRLVRHQERDRRHERQRFERRMRLIAAPEVKLCNTRLRHSQYLQHHSMRLRGGSLAVFSPLGEAGEGEDAIVTSQPCSPPVRGDLNVCDEDEAVTEVVAMTAPRLLLSDSDVIAGLEKLNNSSSNSRGKGVSSLRSSRSTTPLCPISTPGKSQRDNNNNTASSTTHEEGARIAANVPQQRTFPPNGAAAVNFSVSSSSGAPPSLPCPSTNNTQLTAGQSEDKVLTGSYAAKEGETHTITKGGCCRLGGGFDGTDGQTNSPNLCTPVASFTPCQISALLMDSEAFYVELERNGWCTIGAVEEAYLDFAVEDSYCLSFWAFCRLLNEASAEEVQSALDLTTAQATVVLTSAAAVEEHRRAAAIRQLQRLGINGGGSSGNSLQRTPSQIGGWERQVEVVPLFIVSEYTFVTFVAAFIHAYWDMLESMGLDAVTQPVDIGSVTTARSAASPALQPTQNEGAN